jgi:hypothetical protein
MTTASLTGPALTDIAWWIAQGLFGACLAMITAYLRSIRREVQEANEGVRKINGRITKIETWKELHDKQDDERHAEALRDRDTQWEALAKLAPGRR